MNESLDDEVLAPPAGSLSEQFNLVAVIDGLLQDLVDLRAGRITVQQAKASAALGKTAIRGMALVVAAQRLLIDSGKSNAGRRAPRIAGRR